MSSSAASATRREPSRSPAQHSAAARTTSDFTVWRAEPSAAAAARAVSAWSTAVDALTAGHREFCGHPCNPHGQPRRHPFVEEIGGAVQCPLRCREPSHAERIGGQSDQRIATRLAVGTRRVPTPGRPRHGRGRASRAGAGTTRGCCGPTTPMGHAARDALRRDRQARCCSGPGRRPRRPAATVRAESSRRAAASVLGRPRTRRSPVLPWKRSSVPRRYQRGAAIPGTGGHVFRWNVKITLVNTWCCQS